MKANIFKTYPDKWLLPSMPAKRHLLKLAALLICHNRVVPRQLLGPDGATIQQRLVKSPRALEIFL